ncbi:MAG: outer membrane lipoprotein-sorting protein [Gemmatimonadota bacterium]
MTNDRWSSTLARLAPIVAASAGLAASAAPAVAQESASTRGLEIAQEWDRRDSGFGDQTAVLTMVLRNRHGQESSRELRSRTLEVEGDGDKSLVIFDRPRDIEGTAFLTFSHSTGNDDQWLYLPAVKRVKRISTSNKSGPFMGSEFSYEDISSQEVDEYTYRFLRDDTLNGVAVHITEAVPVDKNSGYTKQIVWRDQEHLRPLKIEFFDRKQALLKTLTYEGYQQYLGQYWRADTMKMVNHQTGKSTDLTWRDYEFGTGLTDRDFDRNSLKRVR